MRNVCKILVKEPKRKKPLKRPRLSIETSGSI
jgi:hypothetical protein